MWQAKTFALSLLIFLFCFSSSSAQETPPGAFPARQKGNPNAKYKIEVFVDYQCPTCAVYNEKIKQVEKKYSKDILLIFRHFPLTQIHPKAMLSAQATEAAGIQGKFWEMSNMLLQNQRKWADNKNAEKIFVGYARKLGLNVEKFKTDLYGQTVKDRIDADVKRAEFLKLSSVPTVFLNDQKLDVTEMFDLEEIIAKNLSK
jgi:protein-disulfide isomerase